MDAKQEIQEIIDQIIEGKVDPGAGWANIRSLKDTYYKQYNSQSWNSFVGKRFEFIIYAILAKSLSNAPNGMKVLKEQELKEDEVLFRKLAVQYGDHLIFPDADSALVSINHENPWQSEVIAIFSCKTSLRERIAQSCYWKLKFLAGNVTKQIKVLLITSDNDSDFMIKASGKHHGKSRNRVIAEHELDGVYVLGKSFKPEWESENVRRFDRLCGDISHFKSK